MIKFVYTEEFCKEFKALAKKYRSLGDIDDNKWDFFVLKELIEFDPISNNAVERINQLGKDIILHIYIRLKSSIVMISKVPLN